MSPNTNAALKQSPKKALKKRKRKEKKRRRGAKATTPTIARKEDDDVPASDGSSEKQHKPLKANENSCFHNKSISTYNRPQHPFQADEADHCETPLEAYKHVSRILDKIASLLNKTRATLQIYDPYYCNGGTKEKLGRLGFHSVINRNTDFYQDISNKSIPNYDVLITNPPYSGNHMQQLLNFCKAEQKPHCLLLPHFVYTKDYYKEASLHHFYLVPKRRYAYEPPSWVQASSGSTSVAKGKAQTAPFVSFWYCSSINKKWLEQVYGKSGKFNAANPLHYASCPEHLPRMAKGEFDTTKKRPNPRARKRLREKAKLARG